MTPRHVMRAALAAALSAHLVSREFGALPPPVSLDTAMSIGPYYDGRPGTGYQPRYGRPGRNGRGAAAERRRARKHAGIRTHRQRMGMKP